MPNYNGEIIYLGIDVHKMTYTVTAIHQGQVVKRDRLTASPKLLINYCKKQFSGAEIHSAYEAGFSGYTLHRKLVESNIKNIVVHPAGIEIASRDRVKTDKRDSAKIAIQLAANRLRGIHIPSMEREAYRTITRLREQMMKDRSRLSVQIKSLMNLNGLIEANENQKVCRKWIEDLYKIEIHRELKYCFNLMARRWLQIDDAIKDVDRELKQQQEKDKNLDSVYQSVPGIGATAGRILANELGDMNQFKNERALFSYAGLTPREYSSGEHRRLGHISKQGKPILRKILVQAAWVSIRHDKRLRETFERIANKSGSKIAIIGIARRIVGHIRACIRKGEEYKYERYIESIEE